MICLDHALCPLEEIIMGKRFDTLLFPGAKAKAFTLSYDDGVRQDIRLAALFRKYNVKGTFNIGYGVLGHQEIARIPLQRGCSC